MATRKSPASASAGSPKDEVDAQLARYRAMRDFSATAEPSGGPNAPVTPEGGLPFVIQKHAATRLHYDFRLGWRGVLKSWACAKGPSYSSHDRRLAVEVEDHPMEYGGFEGTIPKGQYGGGTVLVWDQGTWEPLPGTDVDEGLRNGSLKFTLRGHKLEGRWTLVRMKGRAADESKPNWLLIKEHDGRERPETAPAITDEAPDSVVTGRSLEQIAAAEDHVWQSHEVGKPPTNRSRLQQKLRSTRAGKSAPKNGPEAAQQSTLQSWHDSAPLTPMPGFIPPQLATAAERIPPGGGWLHELKLDGYRIQAHLRDGKATLYTRSGLDWTHRMRAAARAVEKVDAAQAIFDGELVVLDANGSSSFSKLQAAFEKGEAATLTFFAFDLLYLNGRNLRPLPLHVRKTLLEPLLVSVNDPLLGFSPHLVLEADAVYAHACKLGAEGILSKLADASYVSGRTDSWLKLKCTHRQEFVIGGFTLPGDGGAGLGSVLLGYYRDGELIHCGRAGTGFTQASARELRAKLEPLRQPKPPFSDTLDALARRDALWVRPELVCEVQFATWTADGAIRHASFQGLRADKAPAEVVKEDPELLPSDAAESEVARPAMAAEKAGVGKRSSRTAARSAPAEPVSAQENRKPVSARKTSAPVASKSAKAEAAGADAPHSARSTPRLTHPDKILDPITGVTKRQLAEYFEAVAPAILPHLAGRPVSIVRCPGGATGKCFFQKHVKVGLPASVGTIPVPVRDNPAHAEPYIAVASAEALLGLAQLGVIELHPWGSQAAALEQPDRIILDLDPDESLPWSTVVDSALAIRAFLRELHLETWVKTTGGKGLHIVAPIEPRAEWPEIRLFARGLAAAVESTDPKLYLIKMTKAARKGRIFLDWMRNERGATAVCAFSPRARAGMRCAVPLRWDELAGGPFSFSVANFQDWHHRTEPANDPWADMQPQPLRPEVLKAVLEQSTALEK